MRKNQERRSDCPINFSLETFGDMWSLLIVRDIVYFGKRTYGEFLSSDERIATNILGSRLRHLVERGVLRRTPSSTDRRKDEYGLTDKGLDLIPVLLELAGWGASNDPHTGAPREWISLVNREKPAMIRLIRKTVKKGGSIFVGPESVVSSLGLGQGQRRRPARPFV